MKANRRKAIRGAAAVLSCMFIGGAAQSDGLAEPVGDIILVVTGNIMYTNGDGTAQFDMAMLKALPSEKFATGSIWYDGTREFEGVSLSVLMDAVGPAGAEIDAVAINDYKVSLPFPQAGERYPILAYSMDGAEMTVRDKGPIWVLYPFDSSDIYQRETIYSRSIWQLKSMNVRG